MAAARAHLNDHRAKVARRLWRGMAFGSPCLPTACLADNGLALELQSSGGLVSILAGMLLLLVAALLLRSHRQLADTRRALRIALAERNPMLSAMTGLVAFRDVEGRYQACNATFASLFGDGEDAIIGRTDFDLLDPETARRWRRHQRRAIEAGEAIEIKEWLALPERRFTALLETSWKPVFDDNGRLIGVLSIARDITEQHVGEETAHKYASYQRAALNNFPHAAWLKDTDGRFVAVSQQMISAIGASDEDEVLGKTDLDVWPRELAEAYRAGDRLVMRTRQKREVVEQVVVAGRPAWVETCKAPIIDDNGTVLGTVGFARDVTERRQVNDALRASEQRFREFYEAHPAPMLLIDPDDGSVIDANPAAATFYGYARDALLGMSSDLINTLPADELRKVRQQASRGERAHFEFVHRLADGSLRDVEVYTAAIEHNGRQTVLSIIHDITERKGSQSALERERDLFTAGPVVALTWWAEPGMALREVSENCQAVLGYSAQALTDGSLTFADLLHPGDRERVQHEVASNIAKGIDCFEQSYRLRLGAGQFAWFHDFTRVLRDAGGAVESLHGYLFDQTNLKQLELTLAEQRKRLQYVIEGTGVGTWEWNVQTGEVRLNERWAEIAGYRLNELVPITIDTWIRLAHPEDLERSRAALLRHFSGKSDNYEIEARIRHKDGHWVWVTDCGRVFEWTDDGKPLWMYGTHYDITERKLAELSLRESEQRLQVAGLSAYDLLYEWHCADQGLQWFGDVDGLLGFEPGEISTGQDAWIACVHPQDRPLLRDTAGEPLLTGEPSKIEYRVRHKDGDYRIWLDRAVGVTDPSGQLVKWVGVCSDVTEQRGDEHRLRLAATVFNNTHEGILITDADARIIDVNQAFTQVTGYSRDEALGRNPAFLGSGRQKPEFYRRLWTSLQRDGCWSGEIWNRRKNGDVYPELLSITAVHDANGTLQSYVASFSDITTLKEQQAQLERIAYFDALTDLPNRVLLGDRLEQEMRHAERNGTYLALIYLDLDGFKNVNDAYGHDVGDRVLIDAATRLHQTLRADDTLSRLGGDEFVAILAGLENANDCIEFLPRMLANAARPTILDGHEISISASLGVTLYPQADPLDPEQLLRQADQAMYQAKLAGKNCYHFFDDEQDRSIRGRTERIEEIRRALQDDALQLYYQPKVNMRTGELLGVEALIRWPQPDGSMRMPVDFLPFIEHNALASELDEWVMDSALRQLEQWDATGRTLNVSVNISAYHLQQDDFGARLQRSLARHPDVAPDRLTIEVLETTALMDLRRMRQVILDAQAIGVEFALDDFGTGYSSLDYLKNLPARQLKIDRSFVRDMLDDRDDLAILEGIVGLAAAFGRDLVAEGVESVEHGEFLIALGCDIAQGFGIGRPMPADQLPAWAEAWRPDPQWLAARRITREELPLMFAMVEHRAWVNALKSQLNGRQLQQPELVEHACRFGRWLDHEGAQRYGDHDGFAILCGLHHQIHELAPLIIDEHENGDPDTAQQQLERLLGMRDSLLSELRQLLRSGGH